MASERDRNGGQSLVEFLGALSIGLAVFCAAAAWFRAEWNRTRCAVSVFEAAHRARIDSRQAPSSFVRITTDADGVTAQGICGGANERVRLPDLEKARW